MLVARHPAGAPPAARRRLHARLFAALVKARLGIDRDLGDLRHDAHGRPAFPALSEVFLSAADRDGWTLAALAARPIGVDIEAARPAPPWPTDLFHPDEARWLASLAPEAAATAFARLWTAKEALAKALNRPIDEALRDQVRGSEIGCATTPVHIIHHAFADRIAAVALAP